MTCFWRCGQLWGLVLWVTHVTWWTRVRLGAGCDRAAARRPGRRGPRQAAAGESANDFEAGGAKRQRVLALVAPAGGAGDQRLGAGADGGAESLSDPGARMSDYTEGSLAGGPPKVHRCRLPVDLMSRLKGTCPFGCGACRCGEYDVC